MEVGGNMLLVGVGDDDLASQLADFGIMLLELGELVNKAWLML